MATLFGQIAAVALWGLLQSGAAAENVRPETQLLPALLLFAAKITGVIALAALPFVYWFRRIPPPRVITAGAVICSLTPWLLGLWVVRG